MSFIDPTIAKDFSKQYDDFFTYFSRPFVVHKEPIKVLQQLQNAPIYGYGSNSDSVNYTYIPVTGTFNGRIYYNHSRKDYEDVDTDLKFIFAKGDVTLRVKQDAKNFIANGKTIKLEFDGKAWNIITEDILKKYLNNTYYLYGLEQTK
jgi:hypothetical protein